MNAVCEPSRCDVVAPIRSAKNSSAFGEIELSWSDTTNQLGMLFQPAAVAFWVREATASGRCVAYITAAASSEESPQKTSRKRSFFTYSSGPPGDPTAS